MIKPCRFQRDVVEDLCVVGPAWLAEMKLLHTSPLRQRDCQAHCTGAARGLHAGNAPAHRRIRAEDIRHQSIDEAHVAFRAKIALAVLFLYEPRFRFLNRAENRGVALPCAIDANTQIDLV